MKRITQIPFLIFLTITLAVFSSCGEDPETIAIVKIIDENEIPINGATVLLKGASTLPGGAMPSPTQNIDVEAERVSNTSGEARFNFTERFKAGQAGLFVLDVYVEFRDRQARGIIKVEEHQTNRATIQFEEQQ